MGELISLDEYKEKLLLKEVEELKKRLEIIIKENDLYVENLPYYEYNDNELNTYFSHTTFRPFDFY